jgi:biopolymer transport protein ExbB
MMHSSRRHGIVGWILCVAVAVTIFFPHEAQAWWNGDWSYRTKISIAAGTLAAAERMPVLIRLHDGNFKFTDAKEDGSDLRFVASDDKTPLKFHIEAYDSLLGVAFIWVDVTPTVGGPTEFWLYYNNKNGTVGADPAGTYDVDTALAYHFAARNSPPRDETANSNTGISPAVSIDTALIGRGAHFTGSNVIGLPATPSLAVAQGGAWTWSGWIKPAAAANGVLYARHDGTSGLTIGLDQGKPFVAVMVNGSETRGAATDALTPNWHHIAVSASSQIILYVDGKPVATLTSALPALNTVATLGGDSANPTGNFTGDMDEVNISRSARSPAFIAAAAAIQGPDSQLLSFAEGEENAGLSGGYFGVILRSVTIDGWVVIGILGVMAAVSITVMINKTRYIITVARANTRFLALFDEARSDVHQLLNMVEKQGRGLQQSVLYKICESGMAELARRSEEGRGVIVLSSQAVESLRAKLDRSTAYEAQKLNSLMVLLTIAISGGPFLGLLGTVVGVMITFAAIAASGDVNINAIAPGIAAALVATVAGLAVAIPALFGYNYLITRIKDLTVEMHVFTDEFVTRLAETYRPRGRSPEMAAE